MLQVVKGFGEMPTFERMFVRKYTEIRLTR